MLREFRHKSDGKLRVRAQNVNQPLCTNRAESRSLECPIFRKTIGRFYRSCFGNPLDAPEDSARTVVLDKNIVVGALGGAGRVLKRVADLVDAGVRITFNYSEGLLTCGECHRAHVEPRRGTASRPVFHLA